MSLTGITSVQQSAASPVLSPRSASASAAVAPISQEEFEQLLKKSHAAQPSGDQVIIAAKSPAQQLREAAKIGEVAEIRRLKALHQDMAMDTPDSLGQTAMHHAAMNGQDAAIETIKALGGSAHDRDSYERTPMHYAAAEGKISTIRKLATLGANVNARERYGGTPLHEAAAHNQIDAIATLIELGASPLITDGNGGIPLHDAVINQHPEATEALAKYQSKTLRNKESIDTEDVFGNTPSDEAVKRLKDPDLDADAKKRLEDIDDILYMYRYPGYMRLKASDFSHPLQPAVSKKV